ncbi:MAG: hypothetical protein LBS19_02165 [Clostridiales bacterium]|nr:hypothetical protein [Clostridiales bacterium]
MANPRKIDLMHKLYGISAQICGDCCNYVSELYHDKKLRKCERYGLTHSEASDWKKSAAACGMFNVPMKDNEAPVIRTVRGERIKDGPMEGQMTLCE